MQYNQEDVAGSLSIDLDPQLGYGEGSYQVDYWIGIRTTEAGSGGGVDAYCTDRLGFVATEGDGPIDGSQPGSVQGTFTFNYAGLESNNGSRVFHVDINVSSPGGVLRYDYRINGQYTGP